MAYFVFENKNIMYLNPNYGSKCFTDLFLPGHVLMTWEEVFANCLFQYKEKMNNKAG